MNRLELRNLIIYQGLSSGFTILIIYITSWQGTSRDFKGQQVSAWYLCCLSLSLHQTPINDNKFQDITKKKNYWKGGTDCLWRFLCLTGYNGSESKMVGDTDKKGRCSWTVCRFLLNGCLLNAERSATQKT